MKGKIKIIIALAAMLLVSTLELSGADEKPAPKKRKKYAEQGTYEFGLSGSFMKPSDGPVTISFGPFVSYYIVDGFHAGTNFLMEYRARYSQSSGLASEEYPASVNWQFGPKVGYTIPLIQRVWIDISGLIIFSRMEGKKIEYFPVIDPDSGYIYKVPMKRRYIKTNAGTGEEVNIRIQLNRRALFSIGVLFEQLAIRKFTKVNYTVPIQISTFF
ncbi:MAG: hypothetical protein MUD12_10055 [Spirochaetes bacterium]|jgi:hypothetical protein|nr:hypothetical protein [Spirochaetota bacterium]